MVNQADDFGQGLTGLACQGGGLFDAFGRLIDVVYVLARSVLYGMVKAATSICCSNRPARPAFWTCQLFLDDHSLKEKGRRPVPFSPFAVRQVAITFMRLLKKPVPGFPTPLWQCKTQPSLAVAPQPTELHAPHGLFCNIPSASQPTQLPFFTPAYQPLACSRILVMRSTILWGSER